MTYPCAYCRRTFREDCYDRPERMRDLHMQSCPNRPRQGGTTEIRPAPGESIDNVIQRFRKAVNGAGVFPALRRKEFFQPKGERRRSKSALARKRRAA